MSIFASETTATIPLPFDAPHTVTIRKLTGRDVELAQAAHLKDFVGANSPRGWPAIFKSALAVGTAVDADARHALTDPLVGYDRLAIVRAGLTGWSYTAADDKGVQVPRQVTPAAVADLDDEALEFLAVEIMRLTKPSLFQTAEEREASRKNG